MASNPISSETKELELALRGLSPAAPDQDFLARLEAAADGTLLTLTDAELRLEKTLRSHAPAALSMDFMKELEKIVADVPFPVNEKIVLFPKTAPLVRPAARSGNRSTWAAAAAVALIGAATALLVPGRGPSSSGHQVARQSEQAPAPSQGTGSSANYSPYIMNTDFSDAKDEGISWHQSATPHRVLKVTYIDKVTVQDKDGKTYQVERPRTEYIYVPEKVD